MSGAIFAIGLLVWLVAAYAGVRIVIAWIAVAKLAPRGQKLNVVMAMNWFNYPEAERIAGEGAAPAINSFRSARKLFLICLIPFFGLILLNALSGNAA